MKLLFFIVLAAILGISSVSTMDEVMDPVMEKRFWFPPSWYGGKLPRTRHVGSDINRGDELFRSELVDTIRDGTVGGYEDKASDDIIMGKRLYIERGGFRPEKRVGRFHPQKSIYAQLRLRGK
ncbi:hypothetical protein GCK72_026054 [Caenorhabditis remanei]|uniref:Uncharacterized protein n=1 Tax=Caenorhabditis remanei TaxID=31234 RepID=E3MPC6_CAERE|nr:hypothetical protein GCK72_026054 [Caenorhabditis remanei]EFP06408.1 hypothetical protein CRE_07640 [Caenorhabditis remanei]KAF1749586.1 hypothetical protein GCK72_026054 [Caenorhabditis remanei]